jgi:hypothetical protein
MDLFGLLLILDQDMACVNFLDHEMGQGSTGIKGLR